ncbi:unnamed protein product [Prunus armeniaca]
MPPSFYIALMWHGGDEKYLSGFPTASRLPSEGWAPEGRRLLRFMLGVGAYHEIA